jgi:hypothetical protein
MEMTICLAEQVSAIRKESKAKKDNTEYAFGMECAATLILIEIGSC